jgi:hypothetical protein
MKLRREQALKVGHPRRSRWDQRGLCELLGLKSRALETDVSRLTTEVKVHGFILRRDKVKSLPRD